jgi:hypothetical protein
VIADDEIAAIAAAIAVITQEQSADPRDEVTRSSRWKMAARRPDLEIEEIRALH